MAQSAPGRRDLDAVLDPPVRELVGDGAKAVVLAGSHARGEATQVSEWLPFRGVLMTKELEQDGPQR